MKVVNRGVVIVKPKQPFLDWLGTLPDPNVLTLDQLQEDCTAFLISDADAENLDRWLRRNYPILFEEQLGGWWTDPTRWPAKRDLRTFRAWFAVEVHSVVVDLIPGDIIREDM